MAFGAGVGLNLTKELVDLLGGEIRAESPIYPDSEHPGTRFAVVLPLTREVEATSKVEGQKVESAAPSEGTRPTEKENGCPIFAGVTAKASGDKWSDDEPPLILIVEDDEDIRAFIVEGLGIAYRVETAENGELGLQQAKELVPDLIVTDIMMPVMDGGELCRELKTSMETSHIPVVMLTAKASLEHQMEGLKTGADDYVTKPFHMELLQIRIANLLESRRVLREQFCREYPVITPKIPKNNPDREFLEKAMHVLEENYSDEHFNSDEFAKALNMSRRTLQRKLAVVAERTPRAFINDFRMIQATELLKNTSQTITEITFAVGSDDSSNFSKMFKNHYGMSPSQYRADHQSS